MTRPLEIVFATQNPGKLNEIQQFADEYKIKILSPSQAGLEPVSTQETGATYAENARLKVQAYLGQAASRDLIICGDDTGIEIDALGGEPGHHTKRWLGYEMSDDEIVGYALGRLHGVKDPNRTARFTSVVAFSVKGQPIQYFEGQLEGRIASNVLADAPSQPGFPFEKLFMISGPPEIELWKFDCIEPSQRRDQMSHRQAAFAKLFESICKPKTPPFKKRG